MGRCAAPRRFRRREPARRSGRPHVDPARDGRTRVRRVTRRCTGRPVFRARHPCARSERRDESGAGDSADKQDEALCPVDFRGGELLIDDDLGQVWDLLPVGVGLTLVFDSCHSGSANRGLNSAELEQIREDTDSLPRYRVLDDETVRKYREIRGSSVPAETRTDRELLFSACSAVEVAYETAGHGDFTRKAAPLVATAAGFVTNAEFLARVRDGFNPRQHPEIHGSNDLHDQLFLFTPTGAPAAAGPTAALRAGSTDGQVRAVAAFLRATADLIDPSGGN
ncbi:caspase family protein [Rhodococcus zopfii]|uniref:Caspase family protein n=1 Tax=Rhodococcus zopfii TaxID=43772 RepID=A0ABU3WQ79_9NOCA|nr:caspase family protein [Rhodococcus zopfii]